MVRKVIWAVDPFAEDKSLQREAAWATRALVKRAPAEVEPVYLFSMPSLEFPLQLTPDLVEGVRASGQDELDSLIRRVKVPGLMPLKVIADTDYPVRHRVDRVCEYARSAGAELLVVSTRARRGLKRWMLGSFAESLILRSETPLLIVNPRWTPATDFKSILYPTDFSSDSCDALPEVARFARSMAGKVVVFHKIHYELTHGLDLAFNDEFDRRRAKLDQFVASMKGEGVEAEGVLDFKVGRTVAEAILLMARRRNSMIAMAAQSGAWATAFLGSTTREVVRSANTPIWVVRSQSVPVRGERRAA